MIRALKIGILAAMLPGGIATSAMAQGVDPLSAEVSTEDADRFVQVFERTGGKPTAEELQTGYLDGAGRGVEIFTRGRIENAENLAQEIAADPAKYRRAIDFCLPLAKEANADLRSIYLGLASVFPNRPLPEIHVVFGAGNSGGTAASDAQVLGLEVICEIAQTPEEIRKTYRKFFAHETVHVLQSGNGRNAATIRDPLLTASLREGFADFIAGLVTGEVPDPERDLWARERETAIWEAFVADRAQLAGFVEQGGQLGDPPPEILASFRRWHQNYRSAPEGWPSELGYWVGRQISAAYFAQAEDKRQAIDDLLALRDPQAILAASGYAEKPKPGATEL